MSLEFLAPARSGMYISSLVIINMAPVFSSLQVDQVDKVFAAALKQKCWDHFSKAQRKTIDTWYKNAKVSGGGKEL